MILTFSGCGTAQYFKEGASKQEGLKTHNNCLVKAGQAGYYGGSLGANIQRNHFIEECMNGEGWSKKQ